MEMKMTEQRDEMLNALKTCIDAAPEPAQRKLLAAIRSFEKQIERKSSLSRFMAHLLPKPEAAKPTETAKPEKSEPVKNGTAKPAAAKKKGAK
jgi:hypothetical protein